MKQMWKRVGLPVVGGLVGSAGTAITTWLTIRQLEPKWQAITGFSLTVIGLLWSVYLAWRNGRLAVKEKQDRDCMIALHAALAEITGAFQMPARSFGLSAYWVRRPWFRWWRPTQVRISHLRLSSGQPSLIGWDWKTGVVGRCWAQKSQSLLCVPGQSPLANCKSDAWSQAPPEAKFNMSYEQWQETQDRYAFVMAFPVQSDEKYLGCISLDAVRTISQQELARLVDKRTELQECLGLAAKAVRGAMLGD